MFFVCVHSRCSVNIYCDVVVVVDVVALVVDGNTRKEPARVDVAPDVLDDAALDALLNVPAPPKARTGATDIAGVVTTAHNAHTNAILEIFVSVFISSLTDTCDTTLLSVFIIPYFANRGQYPFFTNS